MNRIRTIIGLGTLCVGLAACSSTTSSTPSTTSKLPATTTTVAASPSELYAKFQQLNTQLGGDAWTGSMTDAATRANLDCTGAAKSMMGGMSLKNFPTDLALVRTYCPDKEAGL